MYGALYIIKTRYTDRALYSLPEYYDIISAE